MIAASNSTVENLPVAVLTLDRSGVIKNANKFARLWRQSNAATTETVNFVELLCQECTTVWKREFTALQATGEPRSSKINLRHSDGTQAFQLSLATSDDDGNGDDVVSLVLTPLQAQPPADGFARSHQQPRMTDSCNWAKETQRVLEGWGDSTGTYFWETDRKHRYIWLSRPLFDQYAIDPHQIVGRTRQQFAAQHGNNEAGDSKHQDDLNAERSFRNYVHWIIDGHGRQRWLAVNGDPYYSDESVFLGFRGSTRDVTSMMRSHHDLEARSPFFETLINSFPEAISWRDKDGIYRGCNQRFLEWAGLSEPEQITGLHVSEVTAFREHVQSSLEDDRQVIETGRLSCNWERRLVDAAGKEPTVLVSRVPLRDDEDDVHGVMTIIHDITERRQLELKLQKIGRAIEQSPSEMMIASVKGEIEYANPALAERIGLARATIVGSNLDHLPLGRAYRGKYLKVIEQAKDSVTWRGELPVTRLNGKKRWD